MAKRSPSVSEAKAATTTGRAAETAVAPAAVRAAQPAPTRVLRAVDSGTIGVAAVAVLLVGVLAYPRRASTPGAHEPAAASQPALIAAPAAVAPPVPSASSRKTPLPTLEKRRVAESAKSAAPAAAVTRVADIAVKGNAATTSPEPTAIAPIAHAIVSHSAERAPVTITGCLETSVDHDEFRLTDTDGVDAPRSRNWRTGFVKKTAAAVSLIDAPSRLALATHVGRRVTATGFLTNHDLKVSALRFVGPPCN